MTYTDEEKIKRLSAWHESEKKEIAALRAELASLKQGNVIPCQNCGGTEIVHKCAGCGCRIIMPRGAAK